MSAPDIDEACSSKLKIVSYRIEKVNPNRFTTSISNLSAMKIFLSFAAAFIFAAFSQTCTLCAREIPIANPAALTELASALPGDVVILKDGTWVDATIRVENGGSAENPLVIRAQTPGGVVLTGNSTLDIRAPYVSADGFLFTGPHEKGDAVALRSHHGILRNSAIVDYNPQNFETKFIWVLFAGEHNLVDHCYFKGKNNDRPVIGNDYVGSRHNSVTASYFKDIPFIRFTSGHSHPIFDIWGYGGDDENGDDGAFCTIQGNLLDHAAGEGNIFVIKSCRNQVIGNTLVGCQGVINMRSGNFNLIQDNIILGNGVEGAQGIRIAGENHVVKGNFISGCEEGILIACGDIFDRDLTGKYVPFMRQRPPLGRRPFYKAVRGLTLRDNVLVGTKNADLEIGCRYKIEWPKRQNVLLPQDCLIENNRFVRPHGGGSIVGTVPGADKDPALPKLTYVPNKCVGNVIVGGTNGFEPSKDGFSIEKLPIGWSETKEAAKFKPLTAADVGPDWVRSKGH